MTNVEPAPVGGAGTVPAEGAIDLARRRFLQIGAAVGVVAGARLVDGGMAEAIWPHDATELTTLPDCARLLNPDRPANEAWVTVPGLGCKDGAPHARLMASGALGIPHSQLPMSYFTYSNDGITGRDIALNFADHSRNCIGLSIYGHSMGGPSALEGLRILKQYGLTIPLRRLVLNCSPFDISDAREGAIAHVIANSGYQGGVLGKFAFTAVQDFRDSRRGLFDRLGHAFTEGWHDSHTGVSPELWTSQVRLLRDTDLFAQIDAFEDVITADTQVVFCASRIDRVVYCGQAAGKLEAFCRQRGASYKSLYLPAEAGHADTRAASKTVRTWVDTTGHKVARN